MIKTINKIKIDGGETYEVEDTVARTDISKLNTDKLDKNLGVANKGKVLVVGEDGNASALHANNLSYNQSTNKLEYGSKDGLPLVDGVKLDTSVTKAGFAADAKATRDMHDVQSSQIQQNKNDILNFSIKNKASGNPCIITDSQDYELLDLKVYGQSEQNGTPSPDAPAEIVNKTVSEVKVTGKNLLNTNNCFVTTYPQLFRAGKYYVKRFFSSESKSEQVSSRLQALIDGNWVNIQPSPCPEGITCQGDMGWYAKTQIITLAKDFTLRCNVDELVKNNVDIAVSTNDFLENYEPYKEQIVLLSQPIELCGLKSNRGNVIINGQRYISDEIDLTKGKFIQRIAKGVIDGSNIVLGFINGNNYHLGERVLVKIFNGKIKNDIELYSNALCDKLITQSTTYHTTPDKMYIAKNGESISLNTELFGQSPNTEDVKQYFIKNPMKVYCMLQAPIEHDLPIADQDAIRKLKTNYPNTIIDCGAFVETEYCADTKLYIDQSITKYHAQAQANQVAMMSLLPDDTQATMIEKDQQNLLKGV